MNKVILPEGYKPVLNSYDLQRAIALTKEIFQKKFTRNLVRLAGLEPARSLLRGILSPLRLPIPPQRRMFFTEYSKAWLGRRIKLLIFDKFL